MSDKKDLNDAQNIVNEKTKIYRFYGINSAIDFLRPNAKYSHDGKTFLTWDDPRPCPTDEEVNEALENIKKFEDSLNTIWLDEQIKMFNTFLMMPNLRCIDEFHKFRDINIDDVVK